MTKPDFIGKPSEIDKLEEIDRHITDLHYEAFECILKLIESQLSRGVPQDEVFRRARAGLKVTHNFLTQGKP